MFIPFGYHNLMFCFPIIVFYLMQNNEQAKWGNIGESFYSNLNLNLVLKLYQWIEIPTVYILTDIQFFVCFSSAFVQASLRAITNDRETNIPIIIRSIGTYLLQFV